MRLGCKVLSEGGEAPFVKFNCKTCICTCFSISLFSKGAMQDLLGSILTKVQCKRINKKRKKIQLISAAVSNATVMVLE